MISYTIPKYLKTKPKIGMKFTSIDDAFSFYNQYARQAGFSARISNSKKHKRTNEVVWKQFACFKEGRTDERRGNKQTKAKKSLIQQFSQANVPTCQQIRLLEIEYGGPEHVGCTEKDISNSEKDLRDEHKGIDAETLIEFFACEKEKKSAFFFDFEIDSDNRFKRHYKKKSH
ncbi:uncharacterized protein [Henckelia pumila]|uniref:uncharacterized protein n=1 Tax=Henckelia pumila TaxID=405737 RepID=UPI003C6E2D05